MVLLHLSPFGLQLEASCLQLSFFTYSCFGSFSAYNRTHRIRANPEKSDLENFRGPDWRNVVNVGNHFETPTPTYKAKLWTKTLPPKLSSLPCFEAFGVAFCPDVVHILPCMKGGAGFTRALLSTLCFAAFFLGKSCMKGGAGFTRALLRTLCFAVFGESSRGNTIRGNRTESLWEDICLWEGLWEDLWKPLKNLWNL